jgi:RND family efflux transporter MFP subunit
MSPRVALTLIAVPTLAAVAACRTAPRHDPVPSAASTQQALPATTPAPSKGASGFLGIVVAPQTVDVTSQLSGRLLAVMVRVGDPVQRQSVLARLDSRSALQEVEVARADLATAQAAREQATLDVTQADERLARRSTVVELPSQTVSTVSAEELSASHYQARAVRARLAAADATIAQKQAKLAQMELAVKEGVVRAPFDGVVVARYVDGGATVRQGAPVVRLLERGELRVRFAMPEESTELAIATPVRIRIAGEQYSGTVEKVAPEVDAASRMIFAEASLARRGANEHALRSGQVARVSVQAAVGEDR